LNLTLNANSVIEGLLDLVNNISGLWFVPIKMTYLCLSGSKSILEPLILS